MNSVGKQLHDAGNGRIVRIDGRLGRIKDEPRSLVELCVVGQIVHRRRLSSRLLFYDLVVTEEHEQPADTTAYFSGSEPNKPVSEVELTKLKQAPQGVELMIKADGPTQGRMPTEEVQRVRLEVKLGDVVCAYGVREVCLSNGAPVLHCTRLEVLKTWASTRKDNAQFVPQPQTWRIAAATDVSTHELAALDSIQEISDASKLQEKGLSKKAKEVVNKGSGASKEKSPRKTHGASAVTSKVDGESVDADDHPHVRHLNPIRQQNFCKFFLNTGKCFYGDRCRYRHQATTGGTTPGGLVDIKASRAEWLQDRYNKRRELAEDWLVETFGVDVLNRGNGVLDVAGGRGSVSFELWTRRGIRCTLIDPRPLRFTKDQHKWLKGSGPEVEAASKRGQCKQLQERFESALWAADTPAGELIRGCSIVVGMHPDEATGSIVDFALEYDKLFAVLPCCVFPRLFPNRFVVAEINPSSLKGAAASSATEDGSAILPPPPPPPILPPFAPSTSQCAAPTENDLTEYTHDNGTDGRVMERVVTHPQLVRYLVQISSAEIEFLPFEGANQVVFSKPSKATEDVLFTNDEQEQDSRCCLGQSGFGSNILRWIGLCIM